MAHMPKLGHNSAIFGLQLDRLNEMRNQSYESFFIFWENGRDHHVRL